MPRGGPPTYTYVLPPIYLAVPGTTILATQHNTPLEDIEDTFNTEWPGYLVQWVVPTADVLSLPDGAAASPSLTFTDDPDTGIYRVAANQIGISVNGVKTVDIGTAGITVVSTDAGATAGPLSILDRNSASPAASDVLGRTVFRGRDSAGNAYDYAWIQGEISSPQDTLELGAMSFHVGGDIADIEFMRFDPAVGPTPHRLTIRGEVVPPSDNAYNVGGLGARWAAAYIGTGGITNSGALVNVGLVNISGASAGQIQFPVIQNPSSNANTLDDYEEGTFNATLAFATPGTSSWSYATRTGFYTKIGQQLEFSINVDATPTIGTGSGNLLITGLPFTVRGNTPLSLSGISSTFTWPASRTAVVAATSSTGTSIVIQAIGSAQSPTNIQASNMTTGSSHTFNISGTVEVP